MLISASASVAAASAQNSSMLPPGYTVNPPVNPALGNSAPVQGFNGNGNPLGLINSFGAPNAAPTNPLNASAPPAIQVPNSQQPY